MSTDNSGRGSPKPPGSKTRSVSGEGDCLVFSFARVSALLIYILSNTSNPSSPQPSLIVFAAALNSFSRDNPSSRSTFAT